MLRKKRRLKMEGLEQRCMLAGAPWFEETGQDLGRTSTGVPLADLDGDGDLDAFVACYNAFPAENFPPVCRENVVWVNDGEGNFAEGWHKRTSSVASIAMGDLDGDGDLDAFLGKGDFFGARPDEVWLNDGQGNFENTGQRLGRGISWAVALGDVDNDGDLDAFVGRASLGFGGGIPANRAYVWLNDGHGNFTDTGQEFGRGDVWSVALGDLDGDGDLDAYVGQGHQVPRDAIFTNDGHGNFTMTDQRLGSNMANAVELADLDGDGDLDAFVANGIQSGTRQPNEVWLNDGSGSLTRSDQEWETNESRCLALGDIDGDGDLDAYVGNRQPNKLWLNDGSGHFTDSGQDLSGGPRTSGAVSLGDIDGDGDLDAIIGKLGGPNELWLNVRPAARVAGDANGDGRFDRSDIIAVLQAGKYNTGQPAEWSEGDWNGDGVFNQLDIVVALKANTYA